MDASREFAWDRENRVCCLSSGPDEGPPCGWLIVNMAEGWQWVWAGE